MTKLKRQLVGALATGLVVANILAPAAAFAEDGLHLEVSGNGAYSDSTINSAVSNNTTVAQTNTATVNNNINSTASSGGNDANYNTGGDVLVRTGKATSDVDVLNHLNTNVAEVDCCDPVSTEVKISGNGYNSDNDVNLSQNSSNTLAQTNVANVRNDIDSKASSGGNDAKYNTGGDITIITGDTSASADVATHANVNVGRIGGPSTGVSQGAVSLLISGNGANSDNDINLALTKANTIAQTNVADIYNDVYSKAKSGYNDANGNTGGDVAVITGDANAMVGVDNMVNFNRADLDCGCVTDILGKIMGNGYESDNDINASLANYKVAAQTNYANLYNDVDAKAKTGYNDANYNTGPVLFDPVVVMTGDSSSSTDVTNSSNWNVFGTGGLSPLPWPGFDFEFDTDWSWFLAWMSHHS